MGAHRHGQGGTGTCLPLAGNVVKCFCTLVVTVKGLVDELFMYQNLSSAPTGLPVCTPLENFRAQPWKKILRVPMQTSIYTNTKSAKVKYVGFLLNATRGSFSSLTPLSVSQTHATRPNLMTHFTHDCSSEVVHVVVFIQSCGHKTK